jgi:hypothetical protein
MSLRSDGAFHVPSKGTMTLEEARERGRLAFEAGINCAPVLDPGFSTKACRADESTVELLTAWHRGWTLANLAAPVEGFETLSYAHVDVPSDEPA